MRLLLRILKWAGLGLAGLCVAGFLYQLIGAQLDAQYEPPGSEMISVNGHRVHFACVGHGATTYLLDAGAGVGAFEWEYLVPLLAKTARVCSFDRPGLGWSDDDGADHDVVTQAHTIHAIVHAAGIARPFVYVGHSLGGNDAMVYRNLYLDDVAALVAIEPGRPADLREDFHGDRAAAMAVAECGWICPAAEAATWLGVTRLGARIVNAGGHTLNAHMRGEYLAELARPSHIRTTAAMINALPKSAYEVEDVKSFGATPVLIIASSNPRKRDSDESEAQFAQWRRDQLSYFAAVAKMSSRGTGPIVIPNTTHATVVMSQAGAEATAKAIQRFVSGAPSR